MTEEEQLHYALQMSMAQSASETVSGATTEKLTTPDDAEMKDVCVFRLENVSLSVDLLIFFFVRIKEDEDYEKAMNDPEFLQRVISSLPGVDPNSDAIRSAVDNLTKDSTKSKDKEKEEKK